MLCTLLGNECRPAISETALIEQPFGRQDLGQVVGKVLGKQQSARSMGPLDPAQTGTSGPDP